MKNIFICIIIFASLFAGLFSSKSYAISYVELTESGVSDNQNPAEAQDEITQGAILKVSEKYIIEAIGEEKYNKNKKQIADKIIKDSGKFIPFVKTSPLTKDSSGRQTLTVTMRISPQSLVEILSQSGFLNTEFSSALVLPMINIVDRIKAKSYKWWVDSSTDDFLLKVQANATQELQNGLKEGNFYVLDPSKWNFGNSIPNFLKKDFYRRDDVITLGDYFQIPIIVQGQIEFAPSERTSQNYWVRIKLSAYLASVGKVIAESQKNVESDPGDFSVMIPKITATMLKEMSDDFGQQVQEAWKKGAFSGNSLKLVVFGSTSYLAQEGFKKSLQQSVGKLRSLTERQIESGKRIYELDYAGTPEELSQSMQRLQVKGLSVKLQSVSWKELQVRIEEVR